MAAQLPQGGAETGAGGTAGAPGRDEVAVAARVALRRDGRGVLGGQPRRRRLRPGRGPLASPAVPSPEASFRSVRSYADVAEPVRLRDPGARDRLAARAPRGGRRTGTIEVPADFATAGWFAEGPRPGQPGPAVILGHVDSKAGPAVFYRLARLPVGAEVFVDRADGSTVDFRVRGTQHVAKTAFPTDLVYAPTLEPSLRLVTCGGGFDRAKGSYLDNVIVYADPPRSRRARCAPCSRCSCVLLAPCGAAWAQPAGVVVTEGTVGRARPGWSSRRRPGRSR